MEEGGYGYYVDITDPTDIPIIREYKQQKSSSEFYYNTRKNIYNGITYSNSYVYSNPYESYNSIPSTDSLDIESSIKSINYNDNCNLLCTTTDIAAKAGFTIWLVYLFFL